MTTTNVDETKVAAFAEHAMAHITGMFVSWCCAIGDRLGLFAELADGGPATAAELAARAGIDDRYAGTWLGAMFCAGYLHYDPGQGRFWLPAEHAPVLAADGGPLFMGGLYQQASQTGVLFDRVIEAFRRGGGIPLRAYPDQWWEGMARFTAGWLDHLLVQQWLPAVDGLVDRLERGISVAEVGSGSGRALIRLATTFPRSRFVGYEILPASVARATADAEAANVADRVRFVSHDVSTGLTDSHDLVVAFDALHDMPHPNQVLRGVADALRPDGMFLALEPDTAERLEEMAGPMGILWHTSDLFYCMTTALAAGGEGIGGTGLPQTELRRRALENGFREVRRIDVEAPFNALYALTA